MLTSEPVRCSAVKRHTLFSILFSLIFFGKCVLSEIVYACPETEYKFCRISGWHGKLLTNRAGLQSAIYGN